MLQRCLDADPIDRHRAVIMERWHKNMLSIVAKNRPFRIFLEKMETSRFSETICHLMKMKLSSETTRPPKEIRILLKMLLLLETMHCLDEIYLLQDTFFGSQEEKMPRKSIILA